MCSKHPISIQEAPRRHPGDTQEARDILGAKCVFSYAFLSAKAMRWTDLTFTVDTPAGKNLRAEGPEIGEQALPNTEDTLPEPTAETVKGIF